MSEPWTIVRGGRPIIAAAVHDGHDVRADVASALKLSEEERLREEDPYTGELTEVADTRIIVHRSRFEVDMNRPRDGAVYRRPEDAWGLDMWGEEPGEEQVRLSLEEYDRFNHEVFELMDEWKERFGRFIVYDIHSYNHRREGPEGPEADLEGNPEVNLGTANINHEIFRPVIDRFIEVLSRQTFRGHTLDVRENVKFKGGDFSRRIYERYPDSACAIAIEFKKVFMDEWSGEAYERGVDELKEGLGATVDAVVGELGIQN